MSMPEIPYCSLGVQSGVSDRLVRQTEWLYKPRVARVALRLKASYLGLIACLFASGSRMILPFFIGILEGVPARARGFLRVWCKYVFLEECYGCIYIYIYVWQLLQIYTLALLPRGILG